MRTHRLDHDSSPVRLTPVALAGLLLLACGGDKPPPDGAPSDAGGAPATTPPVAETQPAGGAQPQLIALGDSIFHGTAAGGTCYVCHGQDAKGSALAPDLTDAEWLNTDGSLEGITKTIQSGVPAPKKASAPMPPMGGAALSPEQVRAAAAYVLSLSQGKT